MTESAPSLVDADVLKALDDLVPGQVELNVDQIPDDLLVDWSKEEPHRPIARVLPRTTEDVSRVLALCHAHNLPVVPQGGRSGLAGGAVATKGAVLLAMDAMHGIDNLDPDAGTVEVKAGTIVQVVQETLKDENLMFALDLGARGSAQIGGVIATNAGGNRVIRYGMMREMVLGLEVVLADGTVLNMMNRMRKNNAGPDLKHVFIGSEGLFGVITRAVLRLHPGMADAHTALVGFDSFPSALATLNTCQRSLSGRISAFELMWDDFYDEALTWAGRTRPLAGRYPLYGLVEMQSAAPEADSDVFITALSDCLDAGHAGDVAIAQSLADTADFWAVREAAVEVRQAFAPCIALDISLTLTRLGDFVEAANALLARDFPKLRHFWFGHAGDGNLHLITGPTSTVEGGAQRVEGAVYQLLADYGGSISAEHGIGLHKKRWLHLSRTEAELDTLRTLKAALDPKGILNPGKVI